MQGLVRQGIFRGQENSHLEWPDHTVHPYVLCVTLTILVHPLFHDIPDVRYVEVHRNHTPQMPHRHQQLKSIKSKTAGMWKILIRHVGKLWSQALTELMERESMAGLSWSKAFVAEEILWELLGIYTQHWVWMRAQVPPCAAISTSRAILFQRTTCLIWVVSSDRRVIACLVLFKAAAVCLARASTCHSTSIEASRCRPSNQTHFAVRPPPLPSPWTDSLCTG